MVRSFSGASTRPLLEDVPRARSSGTREKTVAEIAAEKREADFIELINPCLDRIMFASVAEAANTIKLMIGEIKIFESAKVTVNICILDPHNKIKVFAELKDLFINADSYVGPIEPGEPGYDANNLQPNPKYMQELRGLILKRIKMHTKQLLEMSKKKLADMIAEQKKLQAEKEAAQKRMLELAEKRKAELANTLSAKEKEQMREFGVLDGTAAPEARLCLALHRLLANIKSYNDKFKAFAADLRDDKVDVDTMTRILNVHIAGIQKDYIDIIQHHLRYSNEYVNAKRGATYSMDELPDVEWMAKCILDCFNGSLMRLEQIQPLSDEAKECLIQHPHDLTIWVEDRNEATGAIQLVRFMADKRFEHINFTAQPEYCFTADLIVFIHRINLVLDWMKHRFTVDDAVNLEEVELSSLSAEDREKFVYMCMREGASLIKKTLQVTLDPIKYNPASDDETVAAQRLLNLEAAMVTPLRHFNNAVTLFANQGLTIELFLKLAPEMRKDLLQSPSPCIDLVRDLSMRPEELLLHKYAFFQELCREDSRNNIHNLRSLKQILKACTESARPNTLDPRRSEPAVDINQMLKFSEKDLLAMLADPEKTIYFPARVAKQSVNQYLRAKVKKLPPPRLVQTVQS